MQSEIDGKDRIYEYYLIGYAEGNGKNMSVMVPVFEGRMEIMIAYTHGLGHGKHRQTPEGPRWVHSWVKEYMNQLKVEMNAK